MVKCSKCGKVIEETMEGIYAGKCAICFSNIMASGHFEIGKKVSTKPVDY